MRHLFVLLILTLSIPVFAVDEYAFVCDNSGIHAESLPGLKMAPNSPVVGLNIKVIEEQVPLFLIKANFNGVEKNMFATDWVAPTELSQDGKDLLDLLGLFFNIQTQNVTSLRAAVPTDLLDSFAYLEVKESSGTITKLSFQGTLPAACQ